jgi:hypothetical protein
MAPSKKYDVIIIGEGPRRLDCGHLARDEWAFNLLWKRQSSLGITLGESLLPFCYG